MHTFAKAEWVSLRNCNSAGTLCGKQAFWLRLSCPSLCVCVYDCDAGLMGLHSCAAVQALRPLCQVPLGCAAVQALHPLWQVPLNCAAVQALRPLWQVHLGCAAVQALHCSGKCPLTVQQYRLCTHSGKCTLAVQQYRLCTHSGKCPLTVQQYRLCTHSVKCPLVVPSRTIFRWSCAAAPRMSSGRQKCIAFASCRPCGLAGGHLALHRRRPPSHQHATACRHGQSGGLWLWRICGSTDECAQPGHPGGGHTNCCCCRCRWWW